MKKILLLVLSVFVIANIAFADEKKEKSYDTLGKVLDETLAGLKNVISPYQRLDPIVITPTRYEDPYLNVSNSISVITEERINEVNAKYIPDVLRSEQGVVVSDLLGNGKAVRIDMRGFGDSSASNVLVLVDGRRVNQIDLSGADWVQIDVDAVERIEVVRGPNTVLYGDNATAGVVNIITKKGKGKKPGISFIYDVGSYRYSAYKGIISGGSDFLDYFGMISTSYNNGYRINNRLETVDYSGNVTVKPADYFNVALSSAYHKDWYGLPGAVKPVNINSIGRQGSISPENSAKTEDYYLMATPKVSADAMLGEIVASGDIVYRSRRTSAMYYSTFGNVAVNNHIKTFGVTPKAAFTSEFFGVKNRVLAGVDYYANKDEINSGLLSAMDTVIITKDTLGLYVTDTVEPLPSFILNGGYRAEWAYYNFDQQAVIKGNSSKKPFEEAFEGGITYKYNDRSSIYAQYSRSYRFPVTEEWYSSLYVDYFSGLITGGLNLDLKPQTANTYQIGIKENSSKYINVDACYNIMDITNELYYDSVTNKNSIHHHTVHHGLELRTDVYLLDAVHAFLNYTYQKAFFVGEAFAGNEIPMVPKHKISAGLKYTFMKSLEAVYTINYVGQRRFANDLKNEMPYLKSYITHDIKISYTKYGFEIYGAVNNIFDEVYSEYGALDWTLTRPGYYPSPRTTASLGVRYSF